MNKDVSLLCPTWIYPRPIKQAQDACSWDEPAQSVPQTHALSTNESPSVHPGFSTLLICTFLWRFVILFLVYNRLKIVNYSGEEEVFRQIQWGGKKSSLQGRARKRRTKTAGHQRPIRVSILCTITQRSVFITLVLTHWDNYVEYARCPFIQIYPPRCAHRWANPLRPQFNE